MWWKTFSAVLAAGLVILGIVKADQSADRSAAEWDEQAASEIVMLDHSIDRAYHGESSSMSLTEVIKGSEEWLQRAPRRAKHRFELENKIQFAKETLVKFPPSVASAKP